MMQGRVVEPATGGANISTDGRGGKSFSLGEATRALRILVLCIPQDYALCSERVGGATCLTQCRASAIQTQRAGLWDPLAPAISQAAMFFF